MISWKVTKTDGRLISRVAKRAAALATANDIDYPVQHAEMDLRATHANGCPLDLPKLLNAPDPHFGHDVFGIRRFIDRETGQLSDVFHPRCARRSA
jgi:hypothetical protein